MSYDSEIAADGPISYWKMEEAVPGNAFPTAPGGMVDFASALNNWYLPGFGLVQSITGPILTDGSSFGCLGVIGGQPPVATSSPLDIRGDLTFECWSKSTATGCETMINRGGDATNTYLAYGQRSTGLFGTQALFTLEWAALEARALLSCELSINEWHHIVGTRQSNEMCLYVDGWLVASRDDCPTGLLIDESAWRLGYMSNFAFGAINPSSGLSHVALYNESLAATRVEAHTIAALGSLPESPCEGAISASGSISASPSATPSSSASASPAPCTPPLGAAISCINAKGRLFVTLASDDFTSQVAFAWHEGAERMPITSMTNWKSSRRALTLQELGMAFETDNADPLNPLIVSVHRNLRKNYIRDARVTAGSNRIDSLTAGFDADHIGDMVVVFGEGIGGPGINYILGRIEALASPSASPSPSSSLSASPSTTESASSSGSPSASPSSSRSGSPSPSHSPSASPSASPSRSRSASPSATPSSSLSASPSASPSSSQSASPSTS